MDKYIGTKMIEAVPAIRKGGKIYELDWPIPRSMEPEEKGYKVRYADGYESWSPKDVFERAYLRMTVNPHLRTDKPSISQEMVDDFVAAAEVTTMGDKCTVVRATLRNGFEIVESSACVSAENYDEKLGADICMKKIKDKVWFLLGFLLQTAVHGTGNRTTPEGIRDEGSAGPRGPKGMPGLRTGLDFGDALVAMKYGKKVARRGWNGKGMFLCLADGIDFHTAADLSCVHHLSGNLTERSIVMKTADDHFVVGWLASQADMLAEDWRIVE